MIINREPKYKGYLNIDELTVKTKKGKEIKREVMRRKNAVAALVYNTETQKYIFVSQFRPGTGSDIIEIPAGVLDHAGEDPRDAMIREIEEEIGYGVDKITLIDEGFVSPGGTTEMISVYFAEVSDKVGKGGGVEGEDEEIDIIEMTREEMLNTRFKDFKTIIAVQWARYNHNV
jgi:nudix-type nucleoside diphosphatase (YffH/AdpP family)